MPKRKSCKKGYSRSRSTGRCVKKYKKRQTRSRVSARKSPKKSGRKSYNKNYTKTSEWEKCYGKLRYSKRVLRVKKNSPAKDAALRSIHNKCVKKLKLKVPLLKPSGKRSKKSKKSKRARRKRNDGSDVVKDVSWVTYYKRYYNDPTFDVRRVDWTGYRGTPPAGLNIRVSKKYKSKKGK